MRITDFKIPQKLKFKKFSKRFIYGRGVENKTYRMLYECGCGLVVTEYGLLTIKHLQTIVTILNKYIKRFREEKNVSIFCSASLRAPITQKPLGTRMGRGKGAVKGWLAPISKGRLLFYLRCEPTTVFKMVKVLQQVQYKLPFLSRIVMDPSGRVL